MTDASRRVGAVTLCAIMKDEKPYILEWVAYHKEIGFDEIVVYSNDCTDGSFELLSALAAAGLITHLEVATSPRIGPQIVAYNHLLRECRTEWAAFLDADEFMVLREHGTIGAFLGRFGEDVSAVAINWRIFGSNGEKVMRDGLVAERFPRAARRDDGLNRHIKSVVRAERVKYMGVHTASLLDGVYVDAAGRPVKIFEGGLIDLVDFDHAQINHYCVKSLAEFEDKKRRGIADAALNDPTKYSTRDAPYWFEYHDHNEEEDLSLLRFRDRVCERIEQIERALGLRASG